MAIQTPEFLQTKKYKAIRDRLALAHGGNVSAGVWENNDLLVSQRAAGANMSVDVNLGSALVNANSPGNKGLYHVESDAIQNVGIAASHATLPRIDQVILHVYDTTDGGGSQDAGVIEVLTGTAHASAGSIAGRPNSAAALPTNCLLLSDVYVPAAGTSIVTGALMDRRPRARGVRLSNGVADATLSPQSTWLNAATITWEGNGRPVDLAVGSMFQQNSATANSHSIQTRIQLDGVDVYPAIEVLYVPVSPFQFHGWSMVRVVDPVALGRHTMTVDYMDTSPTNGGSNSMAFRRSYMRIVEL